MNKNLYVENVWLEQEWRIIDLAKSLHNHRTQNSWYWNYLLEQYPDTFLPIAQDLICTLEKDPHNHRLYMICRWAQKDLWYILLKNYSEQIIEVLQWNEWVNYRIGFKCCKFNLQSLI